MSNCEAEIDKLLDEAFTTWSKQGRTEEQVWAVRNFLSGSMVAAKSKLLAAHKREVRAARVDELTQLLTLNKWLSGEAAVMAVKINNRIAQLQAEGE